MLDEIADGKVLNAKLGDAEDEATFYGSPRRWPGCRASREGERGGEVWQTPPPSRCPGGAW